MHTNEELINHFYTSFQNLNDKAIADCYHPDAEFSDPVFPNLNKQSVTAMWKMLCSKAKGFELTFSQIEADAYSGKAHWEAKYLFSQTERPVHNKVQASFMFEDGKIIRHDDNFDFWTWSSMALGPVGTLLGWTPLLRYKVQRQAAHNLKKFILADHV